MIEQFRVGTGEKELEFPGGAIENKNILSTAMKETKEELNIHVNKNTLKKLNTKPIKMLASSNSQLVTFFCFKKRVTKNFLKYINNSISGCSNDGEHLKIKVLNFNDVKKINTSSAIIGLSLIKNKII
jgi:8-oxo-dGTP pyrophosphatase MutT (NUDIX family)